MNLIAFAIQAIYSRLFDWLVKQINKAILKDDIHSSIGVLDIFGFENFKVVQFKFWHGSCGMVTYCLRTGKQLRTILHQLCQREVATVLQLDHLQGSQSIR